MPAFSYRTRRRSLVIKITMIAFLLERVFSKVEVPVSHKKSDGNGNKRKYQCGARGVRTIGERSPLDVQIEFKGQ
jgi:hypothetical protein